MGEEENYGEGERERDREKGIGIKQRKVEDRY